MSLKQTRPLRLAACVPCVSGWQDREVDAGMDDARLEAER